jgi:hypothetical protein
MRMPTITDHLKERFIKPLAVNRILALVSQAVNDARKMTVSPSDAFELLREEVDSYLEDSWGSGIDVPDWLRSLEREVFNAAHPDEGGRPGMEADLEVLPVLISRDEFFRQCRNWRDPLESPPSLPSAFDSDAGQGNPPGDPDES